MNFQKAQDDIRRSIVLETPMAISESPLITGPIIAETASVVYTKSSSQIRAILFLIRESPTEIAIWVPLREPSRTTLTLESVSETSLSTAWVSTLLQSSTIKISSTNSPDPVIAEVRNFRLFSMKDPEFHVGNTTEIDRKHLGYLRNLLGSTTITP